MPHRATRLVAVLLILLGFATAPSTAQAKRVACWRSVLLDWADNDRLDKRYERSCYRRALRHLRTDLAIYSNARDEIERALVLAGLPSGPPHDPALKVAAAPAALSPAVRTQPVLSERLELLMSRDSEPPPIPLLMLAALALLLLAAGGAGVLAGKLRD